MPGCMNCYAGECGCTFVEDNGESMTGSCMNCENGGSGVIGEACFCDGQDTEPCPPDCVICAAEAKLNAHDYEACEECTRIGALDTQQIGCDEWEALFADYQIACQELDQ